MKVPYRKRAVLKREKIVNYLLSLTHSQGKSKAIYFRSKGFDERNIDIFEKLLLGVVYKREVIEVEESIHGKKYIVNGEIKTPNGKMITIQTVWIISKNTRKPSFVTAYPV